MHSESRAPLPFPTPTPTPTPAATPAPNQHAVQFYEDEGYLTETVVGFLGDGLKKGHSLIVVATAPHRQAFSAGLQSKGFDVEQACRSGHVTLADAEETLSAFMIDSMPDRDLFRNSVGHLIASCVKGPGKPSVRVYGEMVDLLWKTGNPEGAIRLEELWNELIATHSVSLLCAYAMGNFYKESHGRQFEEVCRQHTHVTPAESFPLAGAAGSRLRAITVLQQRAQALEAEIAHRKELEAALLDALARRRASEEALRASEAQLKESLRLKDEFLAVLSHELRTPLNAILGWTQIVSGPGGSQTTLHRALDVIQRNATLQMHLVDDLLDVSRIVTGKMQIAADAVDLPAVASAALDTVRPAAAAKDIDLDMRVDASARVVTGDAGRLQQVIWNLLSNAIKFTPKHGHVALHIDWGPSEARVIVRDTGEGIAPDFLPHVFDRFRQADNGTTRNHGGLGLGLAIVRHLVEAHGGLVTAQSAGIGLGATFTVTLPLRATPADATSCAGAAPARASS